MIAWKFYADGAYRGGRRKGDDSALRLQLGWLQDLEVSSTRR
jgi:hypothetical protein